MSHDPLDSQSAGLGSADPTAEQLAESLGVVRQSTETYMVGGYRYTNIDDAIAQRRRMARTASAQS